MQSQDFLRCGIVPGLDLLPIALRGPAAATLLLATSLQETNLQARVQIGGGPGISFYQLEKDGAIKNVFESPFARPWLQRVCDRLVISFDLDVIAQAVIYNDQLAAVVSRLQYWLSPLSLPDLVSPDAEAQGLLIYSHVWAPHWYISGQPEPGRWHTSWTTAVATTKEKP